MSSVETIVVRVGTYLRHVRNDLLDHLTHVLCVPLDPDVTQQLAQFIHLTLTHGRSEMELC